MVDSLDAFRALFTPRYLNLDGHRYHYVDVGSGPTVVMLHGNPSWSFYYRNLIRALSTTHRVIVPDHMGCGLSDKPAAYPYQLETHVQNLTALLEHLEVQSFGLVVHDWGGPIGLSYAVQHPEQIERILVLNTTCRAASHYPFRIRVCHVPILGSLLVRGLNYFALGATYMGVAQPMSPAVRHGLVSPYDSYANRIANLRFIEDIPRGSNHPTLAPAQEVEAKLCELRNIPVELCWGMKDPCFTPQFLKEWQESFPDARTHTFDDAGHYVLEDATDKIISIASEFF